MLIVVSGSSGAGKNTVINHILAENDQYLLMQTLTTRQKRPGEQDGFPYYFVDEATFRQKISEGEFYEYENVHGNLYGTSRRILAERLAMGKTLLKDIDVKGTVNLRNAIGGEVEVKTVFLYVDKEELVSRLIGRGETAIDLRLKRYMEELSYVEEYDYVINNRSLSQTADCIKAIAQGALPLYIRKSDMNDREAIQAQKTCLQNKATAEAMKVALVDGKLYAIDGVSRYLAAKELGVRVAKWIDFAFEADLSADWELVSE